MDMKHIQQEIQRFSDERDWNEHHNPKNLLMAMTKEVGELVEIFQWLNLEESLNISGDKKEHAKQEVADVAIYLIRICMKLDIDLEEAILMKMKLNEKKYPLFDEEGNKIEYKKS